MRALRALGAARRRAASDVRRRAHMSCQAPVAPPTREGPQVQACVGGVASLAARVLRTPSPRDKIALTAEACAALRAGAPLGAAVAPARPAREELPPLVPQRDMPKQKASGLPLSAFLLHNLATIELNAVDLAWDTVVRFSDPAAARAAGAKLPLPREFFEDFAAIADDEARHLTWCLDRMEALGGYRYGDMPTHDGLWEAAEPTCGDLAARLVVVPMISEARGLDHGERLTERLVGAGDRESAAIVAKIAEEEIPHVYAGVKWFRWLCESTGSDPGDEFSRLAAAHAVGLLRPPFNHARRQDAMLPRDWYEAAAELCVPVSA